MEILLGKNVSRLYVSFTIQRESGHYVIDYYIPGILLVFLSWISFWLEPSQIPGRVTLGTVLHYFSYVSYCDLCILSFILKLSATFFMFFKCEKSFENSFSIQR